MKNKNHNIRFNMEKPEESRAWDLLHSQEVRQAFKSQNRFVIEAVNDYYDRHLAKRDDPYLETREKEDAFADRIAEQLERKVLSNLPALAGMYMAQMQTLSLSVPMGTYPANGIGTVVNTAMMNGAVSAAQSWTQGINPVQQEAGNSSAAAMSQTQQATARKNHQESEDTELLPDNDLLDFDAF
jgi:adenylosuccinate synthase